MSMTTDIIYGYGFPVYVSDEHLRVFIEKHKDIVVTLDMGREIVDWIEDHVSTGKPLDSLKERFYDYTSVHSGDCGIYGVIADVMWKETGIRFEYHVPQESDAEEDDVILFPSCYPWTYNQIESSLTLAKLDEVYKKYIEELGGQLKTGDIKLEYWG